MCLMRRYFHFQAPTLYDDRDPIDLQMSKIGTDQFYGRRFTGWMKNEESLDLYFWCGDWFWVSESRCLINVWSKTNIRRYKINRVWISGKGDYLSKHCLSPLYSDLIDLIISRIIIFLRGKVWTIRNIEQKFCRIIKFSILPLNYSEDPVFQVPKSD